MSLAVPAIELRSLCKAFGTLLAVDHLTLSVKQGEIFGLLGPNGSGKATTINLISGLSTPTSGEAQVMGHDMPRHARRIRQMLGAVPQETALYEELSAWGNLDFHADLFAMPLLALLLVVRELVSSRHALEMAIFYHSSDQPGRDVVVLAGSALLTIGLGILAMRRGMIDAR